MSTIVLSWRNKWRSWAVREAVFGGMPRWSRFRECICTSKHIVCQDFYVVDSLDQFYGAIPTSKRAKFRSFNRMVKHTRKTDVCLNTSTLPAPSRMRACDRQQQAKCGQGLPT